MLHRRLRFVLKLSYYHMLIYGLMPTVLQMEKRRVRIGKDSLAYLIYSVCLSVLLVLEVPWILASGILGGYMRNHIVLQWGLIVTSSLRIISVLCCYGLVWLQRRRLIKLYTDFLVHWRSHWRILRRIAGKDALKRMQLHLSMQMCRMLCVNYAMVSCSILMQLHLLHQTHKLQLLLRLVAMLMISAGRIAFFTMLLLASHQFQAVRLALQALRAKGRSRALELDLRRLADIHFECFKLAKRAFSMYDLAYSSIFITMFVINVSTFYHAVQFGNKTIKSGYYGLLLGDALIVFNTWNSILVFNMVDETIRYCNEAAQVLRQFTDLRQLSRETERELELFGTRLRSNRLVYRICNCVVLDKPAGLGYMISVVSYVIILMQFDLKRKRDEGLKFESFSNHIKEFKWNTVIK